MKLYEVNEAIRSLLENLEPDPETGEITANTDLLIKELNGLEMERSRILEFLAKMVLNLRSEADSLKAEETRLKERRDRLSRKEDSIMAILDRECAGENADLGIATFRYRKSERVEIGDAAKAIRWLKRNKHPECYRTPAPEVAKAEVKRLLKAGTDVPGVTLAQGYTYSLK